MDALKVWDNLHDLFDSDDGSLPEIELANLTGEHIGDIFLYLISHGQDLTINGAQFWDKTTNQSQPIANVENAASLVVQYLAEPFHMVIGNLKPNHITIPHLGLFVFQESMSLDYRKGHEWNSDNVTALLILLCELDKIAPEMRVYLEAGTAQDIQDRFQVTWGEFRKEHCC